MESGSMRRRRRRRLCVVRGFRALVSKRRPSPQRLTIWAFGIPCRIASTAIPQPTACLLFPDFSKLGGKTLRGFYLLMSEVSAVRSISPARSSSNCSGGGGAQERITLLSSRGKIYSTFCMAVARRMLNAHKFIELEKAPKKKKAENETHTAHLIACVRRGPARDYFRLSA